MDFRIIKTVISREYTTRVKKKSFLVTTFVVPILFAAMMVVVFLIMGNTKERKMDVAVVDQSGIVMSHLESGDRVTYTNYSSEVPDSIKAHLKDYGKDALVVVSPLDSVKKTVSVQMEDIKSNVKVSEYTLDESGKENVSESGIYMIISMLLGIIIWMFIMMFGGQVMSSVIEEKSSRVVEVLISSVKAVDLMFGKIIGIALVALTQFLLWIVLTVVLTSAASMFMGKDMLKSFSGDPQMMAQTVGMTPEQMEAIGGVVAATDTTATEAINSQPDGLQTVMSTLSNIPWTKLIISFLIFFILGYLLYASLYAAIGSAVESVEDTQQLQMPITIPLMIAYLVILMAFQNPDSPVVVWTSMIPFTSPIVMLARIPYGVPMWQLVLSIALLFFTFVGCAWLSAKIYKVGILMFGKKSTFKDLWKWLKQ